MKIKIKKFPKQEAYNVGNWMHGRNMKMGKRYSGGRLLGAKWSFLEIDMDQVDGSGNEKFANLGTARAITRRAGSNS